MRPAGGIAGLSVLAALVSGGLTTGTLYLVCWLGTHVLIALGLVDRPHGPVITDIVLVFGLAATLLVVGLRLIDPGEA